MAVTRRAYTGGAVSTTTSTSISSDASATTTITLNAYTGWPYGAAPFFVVVEPGTASEEKILVTRSTSTDTNLTVWTSPSVSANRGLDGTSAVAHSSGVTIYPVFTATDADEANDMASTLTTKGDLLTMNAGPDFDRLGVGTDAHVLIADSAQTLGIKWGQIQTAGIADNAITAAKIAANAVDSSEINAGAVGSDELATNAVTTVKITDLNVTTAKIADLGVTTGKLADGAVTNVKVTAVDASKITTGTLPIARGGTGATTASTALDALGGIGEDAWYNETMSNGWTNVSGRQGARVRKVGTTVQVQFTLTGGTTTNGTLLFTLNSGYRPPDEIVIPIASAEVASGATSKVLIEADGDVKVYGLGGNTEIAASFSFSTV